MRRTGTIVRFNADRGFGFLQGTASTVDVFFHVRDMDCRGGPPVVGMQVDFEEIHVGGKGPRAMAVRPVGQALRAAVPAQAAPADRAAAQRPAAGSRPHRGGAGPHARGLQPASASSGPSASLALFWLAMAAEAGLLGWCVIQGRLPLMALVVGLLLNLATFWLYWHDKHSARQGTWRVREDTLHLLALGGGWPAAWWAQQWLRHKSRKPAFRSIYAATVIGHLTLLGAWAGLPMLR